ncbi:CTAG/Pcc1 family, partial [Syncephalastrum racemosum]
LEVPFSSERLASIAMQVLNVDKELKTDQTKRSLTTNGEGTLIAQFDSVSARMLRVSVNSFMDMLNMVTRTANEFDVVGQGIQQ